MASGRFLDLKPLVSCSFSPPSGTAGASSTLPLTADANAPSATATPFTVIGKAPSAVHATSAQVSVTAAPPPPAPTNVVATAISGSDIVINWTTVSGGSSYNVYRRDASFALIISIKGESAQRRINLARQQHRSRDDDDLHR